MAYKIKKSLLAGTSGHKKELTKLNRSIDKSSREDGRAKSSAFQKVTDDDRKLLSDVTTMNEPTVDVQTADNTQGGVDTTTTTTTTGENTKVFEKKGVDPFKQACYVNGVFQKGKTINGIKCELSKDPNYKSTDTEKTPISDVDVKKDSTKKKKCECMAYNAANEEVGMVQHECGNPNPNCRKRPTSTRCQCTDPQGKQHMYDCKSKNCSDCPKPKVCEGKKLKCDMTSAEMKAAREKCKKMGTVVSRAVKTRYTWSNRACKCIPTKSGGGRLIEDTKDAINKCMKNGFQMKNGKPTKIPCAAYGNGPRGGGRTM
tara:strand:+ start:1753 stop:2697 length:945 start_codon:yes stop_codon:yes gene_type:complete